MMVSADAIAMFGTSAVTADEHRITCFDPETGAERLSISSPGRPLAISYNASGRIFWVVTNDGIVHLCDATP
jgi:hypothetical protein